MAMTTLNIGLFIVNVPLFQAISRLQAAFAADLRPSQAEAGRKRRPNGGNPSYREVAKIAKNKAGRPIWPNAFCGHRPCRKRAQTTQKKRDAGDAVPGILHGLRRFDGIVAQIKRMNSYPWPSGKSVVQCFGLFFSPAPRLRVPSALRLRLEEKYSCPSTALPSGVAPPGRNVMAAAQHHNIRVSVRCIALTPQTPQTWLSILLIWYWSAGRLQDGALLAGGVGSDGVAFVDEVSTHTLGTRFDGGAFARRAAA